MCDCQPCRQKNGNSKKFVNDAARHQAGRVCDLVSHDTDAEHQQCVTDATQVYSRHIATLSPSMFHKENKTMPTKTEARFAITDDGQYVQAMRMLKTTPRGSVKEKILNDAIFSFKQSRRGQGLPDHRTPQEIEQFNAQIAELRATGNYSF